VKIAYLLLGTLVACTDSQEIADKAAAAATARTVQQVRTEIQSAVDKAMAAQVADLSRACSGTVSDLVHVGQRACVLNKCAEFANPNSRAECVRCCLKGTHTYGDACYDYNDF
jgi:hypothetical protein